MLWDAISGQSWRYKITNFTAKAIIIGKNDKNKRLDDKKSPVDFGLTRNEQKEKLKKQWNNIFSIFI
jgi:hypothetical protein